MRVPPPLIFAGAVVAAVILAMLLPQPTVVPGDWRILGLLPVGLGSGLHWWAWRTFRARNTTVRADRKPRRLVTDGPFARTRNPMYLAGILILLGLAVMLGSLGSFLPLLAYGLAAHLSFLPVEEQVMEERFADAYLEYRASVPRWL